jgi:hypothetical protein
MVSVSRTGLQVVSRLMMFGFFWCGEFGFRAGQSPELPGAGPVGAVVVDGGVPAWGYWNAGRGFALWGVEPRGKRQATLGKCRVTCDG